MKMCLNTKKGNALSGTGARLGSPVKKVNFSVKTLDSTKSVYFTSFWCHVCRGSLSTCYRLPFKL